MDKETAQYNLEATVNCINSLETYSKQLVEFNTRTRQAVGRLGQTHQDQNFETFTEFFTPLWNRIVPFTEEINRFRQFLIDKKTFLEGYINAGNIG